MIKFFRKYFISIFVLVFFIVFSFYNAGEYLDFYKESKNIEQDRQKITKSIENFSLKNIRELENIEFYYTPYKPLLDKIVDIIDSSKKRVYIEVYMLTEKRIQQSIVKAQKRGVDVKIILETNPYKAYNINNKSYNFLKTSGVVVVWSNPQNFSLNHTKMLIIDDLVVLSTGNLTYSTFAYNRDMFLFIKDKELITKLISIFIYDFNGKKGYIYDENIVLSPNYSRKKLESLFLEAKNTLDIYFPYLKDKKLFNLLVSRLKSGVQVRLIMSDISASDNKIEIEKLRGLGAIVKPIKKPKIHSKAVLVDGKYLFIGSINFSEYSIDKNREIGILIKNKEIIEKFTKLFKKDI